MSADRASMDVGRLAGWTPFRLAFHGDAAFVDWCHLGARRMVEPFHYETIVAAMREPFNLAFQRTTPVDALAALPPGVPVAGLIFHMSRSGSTLIAQALAALDDTIVVAEATPLRTVLRAHAVGRATSEQAVAWLRGLVAAYAQRRFPAEARLVVKVMAGDVLDLALVRAALPGVPWIFVTRDPAEILASHERAGGIDLMRGQIPAERLGLTEAAMWAMDGWTYKAHVLARFAAAGAAAARDGLILDYAELPAAIATKVAPHFGFALSPNDVARMDAVGRRHAKRPGDLFDPARDPNRAGAPAYRALADRVVGPALADLDKARAAAENGGAATRAARHESRG